MMMLQFRWEIPFDQLAMEVAQTRNSIFVALLHSASRFIPSFRFVYQLLRLPWRGINELIPLLCCCDVCFDVIKCVLKCKPLMLCALDVAGGSCEPRHRWCS